MSITYRPDIDGLRALAVIAVILFHAGLLPGGLIGVDVFFVISGYLITSIIYRNDNFTFRDFYERRVRRLAPALLVVVGVSLAASVVLMFPTSLEKMASATLATLGFVSNIAFWRVSENYFAAPAELNPLLHTWSLAVEEQFYIFYPPFLFVLAKWGRKPVVAFLGLAFLVSLLLSEWGTVNAPTATFYLLPLRAWELLAGCLLAIVSLPRPGRALASILLTVGLVAILYGCLTIRGDAGFPGFLALIPVVGSALVVYAGQEAGLPRKLLANEPMRYTGLISYSLYLWHWPVFVLAEHYWLYRPLTVPEIASAIALSFALASFSYHFIEQPFRRKKVAKTQMAAFVTAGIGAAILAAVSAWIMHKDGLASRYPEMARYSMTPQMQKEGALQRESEEYCREGELLRLCVFGSPRALIWGDSYALHYSNAAFRLGDIAIYAGPRCPPVLNYDPANLPGCQEANRRIFDVIDELGVDTVILSGRWHHYTLINRLELSDIGATARTLRARGLRVVVVGQTPQFHSSAHDEFYLAARRRGVERPEFVANQVPREFNRQMREATGADIFFDPTPLLCDGDNCPIITPDGTYLYRDAGHVADPTATIILENLIQRID